jgi:hypothetical protein
MRGKYPPRRGLVRFVKFSNNGMVHLSSATPSWVAAMTVPVPDRTSVGRHPRAMVGRKGHTMSFVIVLLCDVVASEATSLS